MKCRLLILVIFLVCDCFWARKIEDADYLLLDSYRANWFLKPRDTVLSNCRYAWEYNEEAELSSDSWKRDKSALTYPGVKEECCAEGCNTEEMDENLYNLWYSSYAVSEPVREKYVAWCC